MGKTRKWTSLLACLLLVLQAASAAALSLSFSPGLSQVASRLSKGHAYQLQVQGELAAWPDLNPETLAALQAWLAVHRLEAQVQNIRGSEESQARLLKGEQGLLSVYTREDGRSAEFILGTGHQATRYLGRPGESPWQTLLGLDTRLPDWPRAREQLNLLGQAALPYLTAYEKPVKAATTIKNVGRGASQLVYTLKKDDALAFYEEAREQILPPLKAALGALLPNRAAALSEALDSLAPEGSLTIKRILDKEDRDLGIQVTGTVRLAGAARRLSLLYGLGEEGLYLNLRLPATRGRDSLSLQLSLLSENSKLKADWRYDRQAGTDRHRASGSLSLLSREKDGAEQVSGKITLSSRHTGEQARSQDYVLQPDLRLEGESLQGSLKIQELSGRKLVRELSLQLLGQPVPALTPPLPMTEVDLATAGPKELPEIARRAQQALVPILTDFLMDLPLSVRQLVLHDLGRDQRTEGDSVPAGIFGLPTFVVTDETIPTTKEETP